MNAISTWVAAADDVFSDGTLTPLYSKTCGSFQFNTYATNDSLYLLAEWPGGGRAAFRMAYTPDTLVVKSRREQNGKVHFTLEAVIGTFSVTLTLPENEGEALRYTTTLTPAMNLYIPFWPRDIIIPGNKDNPGNLAGKIHASQVGTRSGLVYFSLTRPGAGSVLYLQDLTALADYCEQTQTSCADVVGGRWPEMGLLLPPTKDKPLVAGKEVVVSDAIVILNQEVPADEAGVARQYLNMLATAYLHLKKPETSFKNWPDILQKGLKDLKDNTGCWSQFRGNEYFNAYVCDYKTPPEIMVQLAILLPLLDYTEWSKTRVECVALIEKALPEFYNQQIGTIMRWLPAAEDALEEEEEQKKPKIMDSWYLHHPMLNLSRMALKGNEMAKKLFLDSLDYTMKIAHHFKYDWPVFYDMVTLEVAKAETEPGKGGEKDVPGIYAHVMLQAYELTKDKKYLREAEIAAKKLAGNGFDVFYQANNTAFSAGALLRLYKLTKNQVYLDLSYVCLAAVFKNVSLWDCDYGFGKYFPNFFSIFPLSNAPYTAAYEEQEVFSAMHEYLKQAEDVEILPSVTLLMSEFIRFMVDRAAFYYPPMLPKEMLADKVKTGEVDPNLWMPLEDLHDGWEKSGEVGQEVYGAGIAFAIVPRHYVSHGEGQFLIFVDYPTTRCTYRKKFVSFTVKGDERLSCKMQLLALDKQKLPAFTVNVKGRKEALKGTRTKDGCLEFCLAGNAAVKISWE